jgi:hypothetical protein
MPCPSLSKSQHYALTDGTDVRITSSAANESRSESVVGVNPTNKQNLICASKKFINPQKYYFTISTSYSIDGGATWKESPLTLPQGWDGMTDPDLTFDHHGTAYLIVEPVKFTPSGPLDIVGMGMYVYRSKDGGKTWDVPVELHPDASDDKQWIDADTNPGSPHLGNIYAVWGAGTPLRFARSKNQGKNWKGVGNSPSGTQVAPEGCFAPSLCVGPDGVIHVSWHQPATGSIMYTRSTDGGDTFAPVTTPITGISSLHNFLPSVGGFPHFPNGTFRVMTLVTSCMAAGNRLVVAWADFREGVSRIYYRVATNSGTNWLGPASGQPLLSDYISAGQHHFHPQLATAGNQSVGCVFYEFGPKAGKYLIDVQLSQSCDDGGGFGYPTTVTDIPWDPAVNAPWSHGNANVTFIGEYFGLSAFDDAFAVVWTDTRTGVQELFFDRASLIVVWPPPKIPSEVLTILAGVIQDGGGIVIIGGKVIRVPPWDPGIDILHALVAIDSVSQIKNDGAAAALSNLNKIIANVANERG